MRRVTVSQCKKSSSAGKESTYSVGDLGSIPGLGRSPGGRHGNPLQYSCLEHPQGQRSLVGYQSMGCKELDMAEWLKHSSGWNMLCQPSLENRWYLAGWPVVLRACLSVSEGHMVLEPVLSGAWVALPAWSVVILDQALLHAYAFPTLLGVPVSTLRLSLCICRGKPRVGLSGSADWQGECSRVKCYVLWMPFKNLKLKTACIVTCQK